MINDILILLGLKIDPELIAGRPDRFVNDQGEEAHSISWGGSQRLGTCLFGESFGEWQVEPQEGVGETHPSPPPLIRRKRKRRYSEPPTRVGEGVTN
jgi:hypothetical protein